MSTRPPRAPARSRWTGRLSLLTALVLLAGLPLLAGAGGDGRQPPRDGSTTAGREAAPPAAGSSPAAPRGDAAPGGNAAPRTRLAGVDDGATLPDLAVHRATPAMTRPLAAHGPLLVRTPSPTPVVVGFHEAGNRHGLELVPVGPLVAHRNTTRVDAPDDDPDGTPYLILSSRGQAAPATSAVDVVLRDDDPVLAPVSGTVSDVRSYDLYGRYLDHRVEIVPRAAPHLRVVLIHLDDVRVVRGDPVRVGQSVIAGSAKRFPFASQIDRDTEPDRWPHVHLEVQPVGAPRPGDQLEDAGAGADADRAGDPEVAAAVDGDDEPGDGG